MSYDTVFEFLIPFSVRVVGVKLVVDHYTKSREEGVLFISYDLEHKPQVNIGENKLEVQVMEPTLGGNLKIEPDLLVLSPAIVPNDNGPLAQMLGLEL